MAKGRMHCFTGLVAQAQQWLGIVEKDDENAENEAQENSEEEEEAEGKPQGHMQLGRKVSVPSVRKRRGSQMHGH